MKHTMIHVYCTPTWVYVELLGVCVVLSWHKRIRLGFDHWFR
jgi:hypothetical protein